MKSADQHPRSADVLLHALILVLLPHSSVDPLHQAVIGFLLHVGQLHNQSVVADTRSLQYARDKVAHGILQLLTDLYTVLMR